MNAPGGHEPPDIAGALEALPLFPLPNAVLFPGTFLPLHVFEPRYCAMVRDVLQGHRAMAVVMITDAERRDAHGHPVIAEMAGVGVIVDHVELPGGRYDILLRGRARVRLRELPFEPPYRRAEALIVNSAAEEVPPGEVLALMSSAAAFVALLDKTHGGFELRFPNNAAPSTLADLCAHQLVIDSREKQVILETLDVRTRVRRVAEALVVQRLAFGSSNRDLN
ncbi:MAG TPA: LON peptidase substrate-binding domain-containing protein [Polyangium sp.]|nr:LON peptidase substrate-binding domain-containing protein [Polyangium sp.]